MRFQALTWNYVDKFKKASKRGASAWQQRWDAATSLLHICGRDDAGKSVHVCVIDHHPVFYVRATESTFYSVVAQAKNFSKSWEDWWVVDLSTERRHVFQGFRGGKTDTVLRVVAAGRGASIAMATSLREAGIETFDTCIDVVTAFYHSTGIQPCGWIKVCDFCGSDIDGYTSSRCDEDVVCRKSGLAPVESAAIANFVFASIDIEAVSVADSAGRYPFPDGDKLENPASCLCVKLQRLHEETSELHAFTFNAVDMDYVREHSPEMCVHAYASEHLMWIGIVSWFEEAHVDVLVGWNILNFDMKFFHKRCALHRVDLTNMGKFDVFSTKLKSRTLSTGGAGHNEFNYWDIAGTFLLDGYVIIKRDYKLQSYGLGAVGEHFIGLSKIDLSPKEIFRESVAGPTGLARVTVYCGRDVDVPMRIVRKLNCFVKLLQFANMAHVSIDDLQLRGANCKTLSLLAAEARRKEWIISDKAFAFNKLTGKYQGALVLDPIVGLHADAPVLTLDFKSLYPSMIISQRLCPHTYVEDDQYLGMPDVEYKTFSWDDCVTNRHHTYTFAVNQESLTPGVLQRLADERLRAKKQMKRCQQRSEAARMEAQAARGEGRSSDADRMEANAKASEFEESVWDGIQLSVKLLMNSIYGFFGAAQVGKLPHVPIAMVITFMGRQMLHNTQKYILCKFGNHARLSPPEQRSEEDVRELCQSETLDDLIVNVSDISIVYGDTDSVFIKFGPPTVGSKTTVLRKAFALAEDAAAETTAFLRETMCPAGMGRLAVELEFEKALFPLICYSKKRYAFVKYVDPNKEGKIGAMGLQLVRRDLCQASVSLMWGTLRAVLQDNDVAAAEALVRETLQRLHKGEMSMNELSCNKKLSHTYKGTQPAHAVVANARRERGEDVSDGDRVDYILTIKEGRIQSERVEDPAHVVETGAAVDYAAIVATQFKKPVSDLLRPVLPNLTILFDESIALLRKQQRPMERKVEQRTKRMRPITTWFTPG